MPTTQPNTQQHGKNVVFKLQIHLINRAVKKKFQGTHESSVTKISGRKKKFTFIFRFLSWSSSLSVGVALEELKVDISSSYIVVGGAVSIGNEPPLSLAK